MISVNTIELEKDLVQINKLLNQYELTYQTLYKELNSSSFFWQDGYSVLFKEALPKEREKNRLYYLSLCDVKNIYTYLYEQYETIGHTIEVNEKYRDSLLEKMNNLINDIASIHNDYNHLDTSFCPSERSIINNHKEVLRSIHSQLKNEKSKLKDIFNKIEKIERNVNTKITKLMIDHVEDFNPDLYAKAEV